MKFDDGLILNFPLFTFMISPGPVPGALQNPKTGSLVAPLWTGLDKFEECRREGMLPEQISVLQLDTPRQFLAFLRQIYGLGISQLAIDVQPTSPQAPVTFEVIKLLHELATTEPDMPDDEKFAGEKLPG
ncbi:MAG: hypothetical protein EXS05_20910 [Planctomycetaceae bacterium]|nr:hypothetical protein [Planctomycetaceae bacterium]